MMDNMRSTGTWEFPHKCFRNFGFGNGGVDGLDRKQSIFLASGVMVSRSKLYSDGLYFGESVFRLPRPLATSYDCFPDALGWRKKALEG